MTCTFASSNPLNIPIKITYGTERIKVAMEADQNGVPIRNSYSRPFQNPYQGDGGNLRMKVVLNFATWIPIFDAAFFGNTNLAANAGAGLAGAQLVTVALGPGQYGVGLTRGVNPINNADWWGLPPYTVRLIDLSGECMNDLTDVFPYWRREFEFLIDPTGHNYQPLDRGFEGINLQGVAGYFSDGAGRRRGLATLLDGHGKELNIAAGAAPVYLNFVTYPPVDFGLLGLGVNPPAGVPWG